MKYDFTTIMDRKGKDAIALDVETALEGGMLGVENVEIKEGFSVIPMWVADMNFPTVPTVQEALIQRVEHPAFGYFSPSQEYYDSIIRWQQTRNGVTGLTSECIGYENGVLGGVVSALNVFCSKGDKVLLHSPTSMPLFSVLPTIPADGCGNAGNWKKPWPFSRNMMSMWFLTRSGLT